MMKTNGSVAPLQGEPTLLEYLLQSGFDPACVAVERNGEIVAKSLFPEIRLKDDDTLEIVSFVGGG